MASIMEEFIDTLDKEDSEYTILLEIAKRKTPVIVKGDIKELSKITEEEQLVVDRISVLEKKRVEVLNDMATVLNKDVQALKVPELLKILAKQPKEQEKLNQVYIRLKATAEEMKRVNDQNKKLIELSLEMVDFDINLIQAMKKGPETGDYNRSGGYSDAGMMGGGGSRFDSKR